MIVSSNLGSVERINFRCKLVFSTFFRSAYISLYFDLDTFVFALGDQEYECSRFQACFLSNKVCDLLSVDKTANRLLFNIEDHEDQFNVFLSLMNGESIEITSSNIDFLENCFRQLENSELLENIMDIKVNKERLSKSNAVERLHFTFHLIRKYLSLHKISMKLTKIAFQDSQLMNLRMFYPIKSSGWRVKTISLI